jgi:voltage-gated potassium channel
MIFFYHLEVFNGPNAMKFDRLAGLAGVDPQETAEARKWGKRLEWPMVMVAIWIPVQWYLEEANIVSASLSHISDWVVWLFFVFETVIIASKAKDKLRYLLHNWMNSAIILAGIPILWGVTPFVGVLRSLRLLLLLALVMRASRTLRFVLAHDRLGTTLLITLFIVVTSGVLMSRIDPSVDSPWEGIWWAWVTVTTVGYGDVVPTTAAGRFFGGVLILLGVGVFALLTANISAFLIGRDTQKEEDEIRGRLKDIQGRLTRIESRLENMETQQRPESGKSTGSGVSPGSDAER